MKLGKKLTDFLTSTRRVWELSRRYGVNPSWLWLGFHPNSFDADAEDEDEDEDEDATPTPLY